MERTQDRRLASLRHPSSRHFSLFLSVAIRRWYISLTGKEAPAGRSLNEAVQNSHELVEGEREETNRWRGVWWLADSLQRVFSTTDFSLVKSPGVSPRFLYQLLLSFLYTGLMKTRSPPPVKGHCLFKVLLFSSVFLSGREKKCLLLV